MRIGITGTPGTGKTTIASILSKSYNLPVISLSHLVLENKLWEDHDKERDSYVIDEERLITELEEWIQHNPKGYIIEGHVLDLLPAHWFDVIIVVRTSPRILIQRLKQRGYSSRKIDENMEAEIMEVCLTDAMHQFGPEKVLSIQNDDNLDKTISEIQNRLKGLK